MSAYTTAECFRDGHDAPTVTPADLALLIERIMALGILKNDTIQHLELRFGRIDQDGKSTDDVVWGDSSGVIAVARDYPWDFDQYRLSCAQVIELLRSDRCRADLPKRIRNRLFHGVRRSGTLYRAGIWFGTLKDSIQAPISHPDDPQNFLSLEQLSFHIDPVTLVDHRVERRFEVGWMSFTVHGYGYLFPWSYEEGLARLQASPELEAVRRICADLWPTTTEQPCDEMVEARKAMGPMWPWPADAPYGWRWGINESF